MKVPDEQLFDTRLRKRYTRDGTLSKDALQAHLDQLEDVESLGEYIDPYSDGEENAGREGEDAPEAEEGVIG